jgi:LPXTG-site transpeptidase (sortase) family protein
VKCKGGKVMFEGKFGKVLTIILIVVILMILIVLGFFTFNYIKNINENEEASSAVGKFEGSVNNTIKDKTNTIDDTEIVNVEISYENLISGGTGSSSSGKTYKGFNVVGTIEIPAINLQYPVLEEATKSSIEASVAVNGGPGLNQIGNTIIIGHNYRNGTFFSNNKNLVEGDKIYITDNSGNKITYSIFNIYTTTTDDSEYYDRETDGKREVTLVTCTDDTKNRLIVCAREI